MSPDNTTALAGLRVLDLTQFLSGPYCTQILGDLGAEIIKLEPPQGDASRHIPPHFVDGDSVYFLSVNRNKKSVVADLKTEDGRDLVRRLIQGSDVVVENFRPGVLDRLGFSPRAICEENRRLIWCSISGFGQDGPYRDKPAYDMIVQALSGGMSLTGEPGRGSVRAGIPIGDLCSGMYGVIGILAALNRRNATGQGDIIDISMLDCQVAMLSYQAAYHLHSGQIPQRQGSAHDSIPTYRTFMAGDGRELVVTAITERMWQGLCRVLGCSELIEDLRFKADHDRLKNQAELLPLLATAFGRKPADEWRAALELEQVPVAIVNTLDQVVSDPHIRHRSLVLTLCADGKSAQVIGSPIAFAKAGKVEHRYPPSLGQDTASVRPDSIFEG